MKQTALSARPETRQKNVTHDQIAAKAYELYQKNGCCDGQDQQHWYQAEQLLTESKSKADAASRNSEPERPARIQPHNSQQQPFARDERGSASRNEIRRETTPMRPASRQSYRSDRTRQPA